MEGFSLVDIPRCGADNMAIDQQMLECAAEREQPILRVYRWSEPTLSLGYFQPYADRNRHLASHTIDVVRRSTGGGAIVHHHDWTYSIALPRSMLTSDLGASQLLYDCVHDAVVSWLGECGLNARKWTQGECRSTECCFLCFERRSVGDIVVGDAKVLGSAQRRHRGALLQHGSLLRARSEYAPSLPGINELRSISVSKVLQDRVTSFALRLREHLGAELEIQWKQLDSLEELPINSPRTQKYADSAWTRRR